MAVWLGPFSVSLTIWIPAFAGMLNGKVYNWEMDEYLKSTSVKISNTDFEAITVKMVFLTSKKSHSETILRKLIATREF